MKYGIYFAYWEKTWKADYHRYVDKAAELGFDIMEISCAPLGEWSNEELTALRDHARARGVTLTAGYGPTAAENLASTDPNVVEHAVKFFTDMLQRLARLDIRSIGGGLYSYWPVDFSKPVDKPADWARSVGNVRRVAKIAGELGVSYCLEVLNRYEGYLLNTAEEAVRFVREVDVPAVRIMLDTFHMNIEEDSIPAAIRTAGPLLGHLHVGEANRRVPGKGSLPWGEIGRALHGVGYTGGVVMEPFVRMGGQIGSEIKVWRDLSNGADDAALDRDAKSSLRFLRHAFDDLVG